jgi:hypothetical protein
MSKQNLLVSGSMFLVPAAVALFAAQSQAATVFDVDFSGDTGSSIAVAAAVANTVNTHPTQLGQSNAAPPSRGVVVPEQGHTDTNTGQTLGGAGNPVAVLIDEYNGWSPGIYFKGDATEESTSGKVSISADILLDTTTSTGGYAPVFARNQAGQNIAAVLLNYTTGGTIWNFPTVGSLTPSNVGGPSNSAGGQILHMDWVLDLDNLTQSVSINGGAAATGTLPTGSTYNQFVINAIQPSNIYGTMALDNVKIQNVAVPEPGSLALLGLGGLALIRRRRAGA